MTSARLLPPEGATDRVKYHLSLAPPRHAGAAPTCSRMPVASTVHLLPHTDTPCAAVHQLQVTVVESHGALSITYALAGDMRAIRIPEPAPPAQTDGLWQHTCFEFFITRPEESVYREYNFSPSGQWAGYQFHAYRQRDTDIVLPQPRMRLERQWDALTLEVTLPPAALPPRPDATGAACLIGLSAVVEATDGRRAYWAVRHPPGRPDFHHRDAFALNLDLSA